MNRRHSLLRSRALSRALLIFFSLGAIFAQAAVPYTQATVTRLENDVSYGRQQAGQSTTRPAEVRDVVRANTFLLSERRSRAELQYVDGAIVRIGENTLFSFEANSRTFALSKGVFFFYVPKGSGGAIIKTPSIAAAITGTVGKVTPNTIVILEGAVRLIPSRRLVNAGQFARKNGDGSITIGYFDKGRAPGGVLTAEGALVRKGLESAVMDLAKHQSRVEKSEKKEAKPTPTPVPKHTHLVAKAAAQDAAKNAAHTAAQNATRTATTAAAQAAAAAASKTASKEASKKASKDAAKPAVHPPVHMH